MKGAKKLKCQRCNRSFWASRVDSKWCSERCKYREKMENAKFKVPQIPRSGTTGVTFNRLRNKWEVRIPEEGASKLKYIGYSTTLGNALQIRKEVLSVNA